MRRNMDRETSSPPRPIKALSLLSKHLEDRLLQLVVTSEKGVQLARGAVIRQFT